MNLICEAKFEDEQNRSIESGDMGKKVVKLGCLRVFFGNISRNMTDTEKMMITNIIANFVADNIVFRTEVLAHHTEELPLEIWELTNFHWML